MNHIQGTFFSAMTNPYVVVTVLFPFLPACALSWKAGRIEKEYIKRYMQNKDAPAGAPPAA